MQNLLLFLFIAADSLVDANSFIRCIVLGSENKFSPNSALAPDRFEIVKLGATLFNI